MSRLSRVLFLIVIGLNILIIMQSCNSEQNTVQEISVEDRCKLAKSHISACMLNDEKNLIYIPEKTCLANSSSFDSNSEESSLNSWLEIFRLNFLLIKFVICINNLSYQRMPNNIFGVEDCEAKIF